jgi:hypothetical protein
MTPERRTAFAARCAALCPGFRALAPVRARKSELLAGELAGMPVIAKRLARPNAVWAWYLAREIAIYRAFAALPPPLRAPRLVAADDELLIIERFEPAPIAAKRRPAAELPRAAVERWLAGLDALAGYRGALPSEPPGAAVRTQLRARLLEDPTAPLAWVTDGLARAHARHIFDGDVRDRALAALAEHAPLAPSHGDVLLRNAFVIDDQPALVDWECAGLHVADWDRALLWTQLAPASRAVVEEALATGPRRRAFFALVVFALAREVVFLEAFRVARDDARMRPVLDELAAAAELIA